MDNRGSLLLPADRQPTEFDIDPTTGIYVGNWQERPCMAVEVGRLKLPETLEFKHLRLLFTVLEEPLFWFIARAGHYVYWHQTHLFCGRCGQPMGFHERERAKCCSACNQIVHPRIAPAIIVAVVKNGQLLLARSARFPTGFMSVLAGFVEPGETLEECVHREVKEEVGVKIKGVRYFGSQPWPFPDSLMIGFTADFVSGEFRFDDDEILEAAWYSPHGLPKVPPTLSIAGQLIEWFAITYR